MNSCDEMERATRADRQREVCICVWPLIFNVLSKRKLHKLAARDSRLDSRMRAVYYDRCAEIDRRIIHNALYSFAESADNPLYHEENARARAARRKGKRGNAIIKRYRRV